MRGRGNDRDNQRDNDRRRQPISRGSRSGGGITSVGNLMEKVYPGREKEDIALMRLCKAWVHAVPKRVADNARPVKLFQGLLTIHVCNNAWANTLSLESESLLRSVQARAPKLGVRKLMLRIGPLPEMGWIADPLPPYVPSPPLTALPETVARELARISSDSVRDAVARAIAMGMANSERDDAEPKKL